MGEPFAHDPSDDLVRLAERDAALREVIREVGRTEHPAIGRAQHRFAIEAQAPDDEREGTECRRHRRAVVEREALLLQVAGVGKRKALHGRQHRDEIADRPPAPPAHQLGNVGVLLLRHDAGPGRVLVRHFDEAELRARPEHELLREA